MACPYPIVLLEFTAFGCLKLINSTYMKYDPCGSQNGSLLLFGTGKFRFLHREVKEVWYDHTENTPTQLDFSCFQFIPLFPSTIQLDEKSRILPPTHTPLTISGKKNLPISYSYSQASSQQSSLPSAQSCQDTSVTLLHTISMRSPVHVAQEKPEILFLFCQPIAAPKERTERSRSC